MITGLLKKIKENQTFNKAFFFLAGDKAFGRAFCIIKRHDIPDMILSIKKKMYIHRLLQCDIVGVCMHCHHFLLCFSSHAFLLFLVCLYIQ